jgi:hypothetical protein
MPAMLVAGFDHDAAAGPFARFSGLIDGVNRTGEPTRMRMGNGNQPLFFSGNVLSLSRTFAAMKSERVVERQDGPVTRQTVTYAWQR